MQQALDVALYLQSFGRASDFTHANRAVIFANYLWQSSIYHSYKGLQFMQSALDDDEGVVISESRNKGIQVNDRVHVANSDSES